MKKFMFVGAFAALLMSGTAMAQTPTPVHGKPVINICTGSETGKYFDTGVRIKEQLQGKAIVNVIATAGSMENLDKIVKGECQAAMVQSDAVDLYTRKHPGSKLTVERVTEFYKEYVHLICRKDIGVSRVTKLTKDHVVMTGPNGGGADVVMQNLAMADKSLYGSIPTLPIGGNRAINKMKDGADAKCFLSVVGLGSEGMKELAASSLDDHSKPMFVLVDFDDKDLINKAKDLRGRPLYTKANVPSKTYANIMDGSLDTVSVGAILVANGDWMEANPAMAEALNAAALKASRNLAAKQ